VEIPETRYARSGEVSIAYQVWGDGPFDLVYVPGAITNVDLLSENRRYATFFEQLASFSRLILFDKHPLRGDLPGADTGPCRLRLPGALHASTRLSLGQTYDEHGDRLLGRGADEHRGGARLADGEGSRCRIGHRVRLTVEELS
jgi:hypothetical protein